MEAARERFADEAIVVQGEVRPVEFDRVHREVNRCSAGQQPPQPLMRLIEELDHPCTMSRQQGDGQALTLLVSGLRNRALLGTEHGGSRRNAERATWSFARGLCARVS